eukprot:5921500-Amphidinium_carterae.1
MPFWGAQKYRSAPLVLGDMSNNANFYSDSARSQDGNSSFVYVCVCLSLKMPTVLDGKLHVGMIVQPVKAKVPPSEVQVSTPDTTDTLLLWSIQLNNLRTILGASSPKHPALEEEAVCNGGCGSHKRSSRYGVVELVTP